jgi:hypothetical protein
MTRASRRRNWAALATLTALATTAVAISTGGVAQAAIPGLQVLFATSVSDSVSPKSATVVCPGTTVPLSAGADLLDGGHDVYVDDIQISGNSVSVKAYEDQDGTAALWSVRAFAVCAEPLPGLVLVSATSVVSFDQANATATCPANTVVVGTAVSIEGGRGEVVLDEIRPLSNNTEVHAYAYEDQDGTANVWDLTAVAACATQPAGYEVLSITSADNSRDKGQDTGCSSVAKSPIGGGVEITGGQGETSMERLWFDTTTVHAGGREDDDGNGDTWKIRTIAICATP